MTNHPSPKIVICCDSFKGSMTSLEAGTAAAMGVKEVLPEADVITVPVADGGEGLQEALLEAKDGKRTFCRVTGPAGDEVQASYADIRNTAVIEIAAACGLGLLSDEQKNPLKTTTFGVGQLINKALEDGCREFLIGLGGSATNDAGIGMLQALGFRLLDKSGVDVGPGGENVGKIVRIETERVNPQLKEARFTVACDVNNPLIGPLGASVVFGPQKGADSAMIAELENGLYKFSKLVREWSGKSFDANPGAGAAGGLGFAFMAFLNAKLQPGIELVLDFLDFDELIADANLIITGEGCLDSQTCMGKAPYGILMRGLKANIPIIAIGGKIENHELLQQAGFYGLFSINTDSGNENYMRKEIALKNVRNTVGKIIYSIYLKN